MSGAGAQQRSGILSSQHSSLHPHLTKSPYSRGVVGGGGWCGQQILKFKTSFISLSLRVILVVTKLFLEVHPLTPDVVEVLKNFIKF